MNANEIRQPAAVASRRFSWPKAFAGALIGAFIGAFIGIMLSKYLWLGERLQQLNVTNTGTKTILVQIDTKRLTGDGDVVIEPGKVGSFIYGEGDTLAIFPGAQANGPSHNVTLVRKSILAEANADDKDKILFAYKSE
jgi:hypothetical protein